MYLHSTVELWCELVILCYYLVTHRGLNSTLKMLSIVQSRYHPHLMQCMPVGKVDKQLFAYEAGLSLLQTGVAGGELGC